MTNDNGASTSGSNASNASGSNSTSDIKEVVAALSAVVGVFAALAVSGVLGQTQRNHGLQLVIALGLVLLGAVLWLLATLSAQRWVRYLAVIALAAGLLIGVLAIWSTQTDSERPEVISTYDPAKKLITITASAHGLRSDSRLVVVVSGLRGTPDSPKPVANPPTLYYAVVGPNGDGDVTHTADIPIPQKYTLVGVKTWTGKEPGACTTVETDVATETPQHDRVGCLLLQIRTKPNRERHRPHR